LFTTNPKYARGSVFFSSTLDAIIAQSYFNNPLFEVLDKLIFGSQAAEQEYQQKEDNAVSAAIKENCKLNMVRIGADLGGKITMNQFFQICIHDSEPVIPIGIYRHPNQSILGNESEYVITNPDRNCLLFVIHEMK